MMVHPVDAYSAARNDDRGFVGWATYRCKSVGLWTNGDDRVTMWSAEDTDAEVVIGTEQSADEFLAEVDRKLSEFP